jgi:MoaA/NifB/PqqE/SkfB family radical SAM enzyme
MVVTRRCNLACGYCNEYDAVSSPVPTEQLLRQIDRIAEMGTLVLTLTGGEPLLHPELDRIIAHAATRRLICTSITNGYALTPRWIDRLNGSGLTLLQISIDTMEPNESSEKSWRLLENRLTLLADRARFAINVNAVLGTCSPDEVAEVAARVRRLGFYMTLGLMHGPNGQAESRLFEDGALQLYDDVRRQSNRSLLHRVGERWERRLLRTGTAPWTCRAGARFLYIDEAGIVSYCSQRRGEPGVPLATYTAEHLRRGRQPKGCEVGCTLSCVRRASAPDAWRA